MGSADLFWPSHWGGHSVSPGRVGLLESGRVAHLWFGPDFFHGFRLGDVLQAPLPGVIGNACFAARCLAQPIVGHVAERWCDDVGHAFAEHDCANDRFGGAVHVMAF